MKSMHFKALSSGHQNEQILTNFQEIAFHHLVYLHEILSILIKSPDFNDIKEIANFFEIMP